MIAAWISSLVVFLAICRSIGCYPVPIPGTADGFSQTLQTLMRQTFLTDYKGFQYAGCEGEGCCATTCTAEADRWQQILVEPTANCGNPPTVRGFSPSSPPPYTCVQKRSYKRACRRALMHGSAHYHGIKMHPRDFPIGLVQKLSAEQGHKTGPRYRQITQKKGAERLHILYWNAGGLSQPTFLELKYWLRSHPIDLVVIAETRWSFSSQWEDAEWSFLHSATDTPKSGGLLVMVARRLAHPSQLGYESVAPGRLLHVRVHGDSHALDLLAIYQFADYRNATAQQNRDKIWVALDDHLRSLPLRNNLICAGDFNTDLRQQPPWVGSTTFRWQNAQIPGSQHMDQARLQELLRSHGLTAMNSWGGSGATYMHGTHAARIDFLLTRIISCDGQSKKVQYLDHADFVPHNQSHHIPMLGSIRKFHLTYHRHQRPTQCSYAQRNQCRVASLEETQAWHQLRQHVIDAVTATHVEATPEEFIAHVHDQVSEAFHSLFPNKTVRFPKPDFTAFHHATEDKWFHRRQLKNLQHSTISFSLRHFFQAWFHRSRYDVVQRQQQRRARQAHRLRFQMLCREVDQAARYHDSHTMFAIINKFAPKRPMARARLKGPDGRIADQYLAQSMTVAFVQQMWSGTETLPTYSDGILGVPFTLDSLTRAIAKLHGNKSVAQPFLPAIIWKSAPLEVAASLYRQLQYWWHHSPPMIPQSWRDSWLYFIPKPGKPNTHPSQMRPISLMEPLGKLVLGLVATLLKQHLGPILRCYPHFGFMPQRAATDAIQRVASHSRDIRALIGTQRRSVQQQMTNTPKFTFCGGLSLFLDMSRAFDCANRRILFDHLYDLQTQPELVQLVASWHENTHYNLQFAQTTIPVRVTKGLRQGCKIAPQLWVIYMDKFLRLLEPHTGAQWIAACITIYADDVHVGCKFTSNSEFTRHLRNLGFVLDALEQLDLQLSYQKSFILLRYAGTNPRPSLKGRIRRQGKDHFLLVPRRTGHASLLPLRNKGSYLGVVISYAAFEQQSWAHRKQLAWLAYNRLKSWLRHRDIQVKQRLHLWKQCVFTVLTYGLFATGVTVPILHDFQGTIYRMLRMILNDRAYRTHHSHQQVFGHFRLDHPLDMLGALASSLLQSHCRRAQDLAPNDFLHRVDWSSLYDVIHMIDGLRTTVVEVPISSWPQAEVQTQALLHCPVCDYTAATIANLRRHLTIQHGCRQYRTAPFEMADFSLNGSSQCNRCFRTFTSWNSFFIHVQRQCCQVMTNVPSALPEHVSAAGPSGSDQTRLPDAARLDFHVMHKSFWPELQEHLVQADWMRFPRNADMLDYLTHYCAICGVWCNRFQELHGHYIDRFTSLMCKVA